MSDIGEQQGVLEIFSKAVDQSSFVLRENAKLLFQELYNRLQCKAEEERLIKDKLESERGRYKKPWIHCVFGLLENKAMIRSFTGHKFCIMDCVFSPDGKHILTASIDKTLKIWNATTGEELLTLVDQADVTECAFSPDGRRIISGNTDLDSFSSELQLTLWDSETGEKISVLHPNSRTGKRFAFSQQGNRSVAPTDDNTFTMWDTESGNKLLIFRGHTGDVLHCAFSSDGKRIASASSDMTIKVWDTSSGEEIMILEGHADKVSTCSFNPNGKYLIAGTHDGQITLWDFRTGELIASLRGHESRIVKCFFTFDGTKIVSGDVEDNIKILDVPSMEELFEISGESFKLGLSSLNPEGTRIIIPGGSGDHTFYLINAENGKEIANLVGHTDEAATCAFSPDGKFIITAGEDSTLMLWDTKIAEDQPNSEESPGEVGDNCCFSPGGRKMLSTGCVIKLWDAVTFAEIATLDGHERGVYDCEFNPDGSMIVSCGGDNVLKLWDAESGQNLMMKKLSFSNFDHCLFSLDGKRIVTQNEYHKLTLWDVKSKTKIASLENHEIVNRYSPYCPDGRLLIESRKENALKLWDIEKAGEIVTFIENIDGVRGCSFSPEGKQFVYNGSDDQMFHFWDVESGHEIESCPGYSTDEVVCQFSTDGKFILTAVSKEDRSEVKLWDALTHEVVRTFFFRRDTIANTACIFSQDSYRILWASWRTIKVWDLESGDELSYIVGSGGINSLSFHPEGRKIFAGNKEGRIFVLSLENVEILPAVVTPYFQSGALFFRCPYCIKINKIKEESLGQRINCPSCEKKIKINPFYIEHPEIK